jgi:Na+/H+ antiporter NhaD/arsenite permease-like protein
MMFAEADPRLWMVAPFMALLGTIALAPLFFANWWGRHFVKVSLGLGAAVAIYYVLGLHAQARVFHTGLEYFSFISLIGSLYVVSGGIHITVQGEATPKANALFLLIGAIASNLLGTTGASMLLIRPWLRMNKYRLTAHHIVFFIFLVSNVGGSLTPVGDPPLFLGYLKGVPFWWVAATCWSVWLTGVGLLLAMFLVVDTLNFRRAPTAVRELETAREKWRFEGLGNLVFLGIILAATLINRPPFLREALMLSAAVGSYLTTRKPVHEANDFNFHPIKEVAVLFAGIFATMMPALDWLQNNAAHFGQSNAAFFFWSSGTLSSVLDNAPTYLAFLSADFGAFTPTDTAASIAAYLNAHGTNLSAAASMPHAEQICQAGLALRTYFPQALSGGHVAPEQIQMAQALTDPLQVKCLRAISIGSVFFGANTYIGNGPNFMVKAIADQQKAHTPGFLNYVFRFTLPYMLPMLIIVWWFFFRT